MEFYIIYVSIIVGWGKDNGNGEVDLRSSVIAMEIDFIRSFLGLI